MAQELQTFEEVVDANLTYVGTTGLGAGDGSKAVWSLKRIKKTGLVTETLRPTGENGRPTADMAFVWNNRSFYNYSATDDTTSPTMVSASKVSFTQIKVTFSEALKPSSVTKANAGGFTVSERFLPGTTYAVTAVAPGANPKEVLLTIANYTASAQYGLEVRYTLGGNGTVQDIAGNYLQNFSADTLRVAPVIVAAVFGNSPGFLVPEEQGVLFAGTKISGLWVPSIDSVVTNAFAGATGVSVVSDQGGTIGTVTIVSGQLVFDYTTPMADPDNLSITGTDQYGQAFDLNVFVSLPY